MHEEKGLVPSEVDDLLSRISLDMNCYLYNIRFDPIENLFLSSPTTFTSDLPLPTERQILYVAGQLEKFRDKYFEHIEDDVLEFKSFQAIVNGIVDKKISAIPIINFMIVEEKLALIGDGIKLV